MGRALTVLLASTWVPTTLALSPLIKTYHDRVEGEWIGPIIFDENALKALDKRLGMGLGPSNLRGSNSNSTSSWSSSSSSYAPSQAALETLVGQHGRRMLDVCAAIGNVALTTVEGTAEQSDVTNEAAVREVGSSIYGPFEDGFGSAQDFLITGFGCDEPSLCYSDGGIDTQLAEAACAHACEIELPRWDGGSSDADGGTYVGFLDTCGGHASDFHFHQSMHCLYDESGSHSAMIGEGTNDDASPLYGKWEDYDNGVLPELDACGGHYGYTPESTDTEVYHHHVQDSPPFAFGCYGPNDDGSLVTVEQCRAIYSDCDGDLQDITTEEGTIEYDAWCPCWDGSGLGFSGAGLNTGVDIVPLPATSPSPTVSMAPTPDTWQPTQVPAPAPTATDNDGPDGDYSGPGGDEDDGGDEDGSGPGEDDGDEDGNPDGDNSGPSDDDDDDPSPTKFPTKAPFPAPTKAPFPVPTVLPTVTTYASVEASITLSGVDAANVDDDEEAAIATGVASVMDGVAATDITDMTVTDASDRRRNLLSSSALVEFTVALDLEGSSFADADELFETVDTALTSAVSDSTELVTAIQDASSTDTFDSAEVDAAEATLHTRSPSLAPTLSMSPTTSTSDSSSELEDWVWVCVGLGAAVVLIGCCCFLKAQLGGRNGSDDGKKPKKQVKKGRKAPSGKYELEVEELPAKKPSVTVAAIELTESPMEVNATYL